MGEAALVHVVGTLIAKGTSDLASSSMMLPLWQETGQETRDFRLL